MPLSATRTDEPIVDQPLDPLAWGDPAGGWTARTPWHAKRRRHRRADPQETVRYTKPQPRVYQIQLTRLGRELIELAHDDVMEPRDEARRQREDCWRRVPQRSRCPAARRLGPPRLHPLHSNVHEAMIAQPAAKEPARFVVAEDSVVDHRRRAGRLGQVPAAKQQQPSQPRRPRRTPSTHPLAETPGVRGTDERIVRNAVTQRICAFEYFARSSSGAAPLVGLASGRGGAVFSPRTGQGPYRSACAALPAEVSPAGATRRERAPQRPEQPAPAASPSPAETSPGMRQTAETRRRRGPHGSRQGRAGRAHARLGAGVSSPPADGTCLTTPGGLVREQQVPELPAQPGNARQRSGPSASASTKWDRP